MQFYDLRIFMINYRNQKQLGIRKVFFVVILLLTTADQNSAVPLLTLSQLVREISPILTVLCGACGRLSVNDLFIYL